MRPILTSLSLASILAGMTAVRAADELTPLRDPPLTMPTPIPVVPSASHLSASPVEFYRPNRWDVWQHYGVDRRGRWVPRVLLTGEGEFYYSNGMPYPVSVNQMNVMPYLFD